MIVIALLAPPSQPAMAEAAYGGILGDGFTVHAYWSQDDVPDDVAGSAEAIIAAAGCDVDAGLLSRAPKLRLIQVPGHGFDHVSLDDAAAAGVPVATVASSGAEAHTVAEMALLLAGVASRRVIPADRFVRGGRWGAAEVLQGGVFELAGKTLGIVGMGLIGRELAKRALAFDMRVIGFDVVPFDVTSVERVSLGDLLEQSDVVSLHAPLTPKTRHLIDAAAIGRMKPTAVLVNTARGALIDETALAAALREGRLRAAALDVFDPEPPGADNPLHGLDNVVLSPHMGGVTAESVMRILAAAMDNVRRVARGDEPLDVLEPGAAH